MILAPNEWKARKYGNGKKHSGPSGRRAGRLELGKDRGRAFMLARKRPIWILLANEGNSMIKKGEL